jgi:hypothetical protein
MDISICPSSNCIGNTVFTDLSTYVNSTRSRLMGLTSFNITKHLNTRWFLDTSNPLIYTTGFYQSDSII